MPTSTPSAGSGNHNTLAAELRTQVNSLLSECLEELSKLAKDPEFRSDPTCNNIYQRYDALDAFMGAHERFCTDYPLAVTQGFYRVLHSTTTTPLDSDPHNLELVDADELEINIVITRIVQKAEEIHKEVLFHLELRLEELGLLQGRRINPFCLHPSSLYRPYQTLALSLEIEVQSKALLCQFLEQLLSPKLSGFYRRINQLLMDNGILADDKRLHQAIGAHEKVESTTPLMQLRPPPIDSVSTGEFFAPVDTRRWHPESAPATALSMGNTHPNVSSSSHFIDADSLRVLQRYFNPTAASQQITENLLEQPLEVHPASMPVVETLSVMQRKAFVEQEFIAAQSIKDFLGYRLAAVQTEAVARTEDQAWELTENEEKIIDFVNQIFAAIIEDAALTDAVKALLFKLQIPVIKLALLDFTFIQNALHPARRLLNELASLSVNIDDKQEPLFKKLESIVNSVIEDFEIDTKPFEVALRQLRKIDHIESAQARETELENLALARTKAQRSVAKRKVMATLKRVMKDTQMPDCVMDFILKCWAPYMGAICLREGIQSENWQRSVLALQQIIEASQPGCTRSEVEQILGIPNHFFNKLQEQLINIHWRLEDQQGILSNVREWFNKIFTRPDSTLSETENTEQIVTQPNSATVETTQLVRPIVVLSEVEADEEELKSKLNKLMASLPSEVKPGAWFEIYRGEDKAKRRLKLSTILTETGQLLFADRRGHGVLNVELEGFLEDLREGRTKLIDDNNRFDQALSHVINTIRANQEKHALA